MKVGKAINMIGVILAFIFFVLRILYPEIITGFLWVGTAFILCIMMLYKTENTRPINILGLVLFFILSALHLIFGDKLDFLISSLPGFIIVILLSILMFNSKKKVVDGKTSDDIKNDE